MQRQCEIIGVPEICTLEEGMDFRLPQYRREVFLKFYEFHCRYNAHPGAVYYAFPYIFKKYGMNIEEKLWFAYINGICQNVVTTHHIWERFPNFHNLDINLLSDYFRQNYPKFGWDTDRRYVKNQFERCILDYKKNIGNKTQEEYFAQFTSFGRLWNNVIENFYLFGRLATFSYLEYLKIAGLPFDCNTLFLDDISGSKSHRNGLCKVLGRDDLDWRDGNEVKYDRALIEWLTSEGEILLQEAKQRVKDASYFTLESTLCCYKSWHRVNRRYPNVYNDMFYERILRNEKEFGCTNTFFRQMRKELLPRELRIEDNKWDVGLKPQKQNYYLTTGQVIMMDIDYPCFKNNYYESVSNNRGLWSREDLAYEGAY
jgi:hypothetical protein